MKNHSKYSAVIFMLLLPLISWGNDRIILKGNAADPFTKLSYTVPATEGYYEGFTQTITLDHTGTYRIEVPIPPQSLFLTLFAEEMQYTLVLENGQEYEIDIDISNTENPFTYKGPNKAGMDYFNKLPVHQLSSKFGTVNDPKIVIALINDIQSDKALEIAKLNHLLSEGQISDQFVKAVKRDRDIYYASYISTAVKPIYIKATQENKDIAPGLTSLVNQLYETYSPLEIENMQSRWWVYYMDVYMEMQQYMASDFSMENILHHHQNNTLHSYHIGLATKHLNDNALKFYLACYIYRSASKHNNEKELIQLADSFDESYWDNPYSPYFQPYIAGIKNHYKNSVPDTKDYALIVDTHQINTLKEAVLLAKGKPVYVDVWATWCAPCIKEFVHKPEVNKLLEEYGYAPLYISIDEEKNEVKWKEKIVAFNLEEGYHLRANQNLKNELMRLYGTSGSLTIPIYILFDGEGELLEKHAARPSDINKLKMHLERNRRAGELASQD